MAEALEISRAAIWKHISNARASGFKIVSSPKRGYRIEKFPLEVIVPELVALYYGGMPPFEIIRLEKTVSTNNYAKEIILDGKKNNFLVVSEEQTGGRGRFDRKWASVPRKDLTFTLSLSIDRPASEFYKFTMLAGLAVYNAVRDILPAPRAPEAPSPCIKWPNDIYIGDRKLCGILSEMIAEEMRIVSIVIGIGINVNSENLPENAISVKNITGADTDRNKLLSSIIKYFDGLFARYQSGGFSSIFVEWKKSLGWIGKDVSFNDGLRTVSGRLSDIYENGAVVIKIEGADRVFYSGDLIPGKPDRNID